MRRTRTYKRRGHTNSAGIQTARESFLQDARMKDSNYNVVKTVVYI